MTDTLANTDREPTAPAVEALTDPPPAPAAVTLVDVVKRYGELVALDGLSLEIRQGEVLGLLGPNGSGKTTTVNLLCGLARPTSGTITVMGHDVGRDPASIRPLLGVVSQETALYDELDAWANLAFHAELYGVPRRERAERVERILTLVALLDRRNSRVKTFSGGMKRRLAIGRALLHEPRLLYLDEPTLGVDVASRRTIWNHISHMRAEGKTVLLTTNYLEEASELCDRILIMNRGRIVALGTPQGLRRQFGSSVVDIGVEGGLTAALRSQVESIAGVVVVEATPGGFSVTYADGVASAAAIVNVVAACTALTSIQQRSTTLDEVFLHLTDGGDG